VDLSSVSNGDVTIRYNDPLRRDPHLSGPASKSEAAMTRSLGTSARADSQTSGAITAVGWVAGVVFGYAAKAAHLTPGSHATALIRRSTQSGTPRSAAAPRRRRTPLAPI
jgi:hypothetical protein